MAYNKKNFKVGDIVVTTTSVPNAADYYVDIREWGKGQKFIIKYVGNEYSKIGAYPIINGEEVPNRDGSLNCTWCIEGYIDSFKLVPRKHVIGGKLL